MSRQFNRIGTQYRLLGPVNTIQEGIYITAASIESAGNVNNTVILTASEGVTLKPGFSVGFDEIFEANNAGCTYIQDYTVEHKIDPYTCLKMNAPNTYLQNELFLFGDLGGWMFCTDNIFSDVKFYSSYNLLYSPPKLIILTEPLSAEFQIYGKNYDQREMLYSAIENGQTNGVLYYRMVTDEA